MRLRDKIALLLRLDALIRRQATDSPEELATRLAVSRPTVHRYLNELRSFGAPIEYCRYRHSYVYAEAFQLRFQPATELAPARTNSVSTRSTRNSATLACQTTSKNGLASE